MAEASRLRFEVSGVQDDFESSLDYIVRARTELQKSSDEEDLVETLARLYHKEGLAHLARYQRIGDIANIANAVQSWKNAVDLTPADIYHRHDKIKYLTSLADACQARFAELGEIEDADDAVATLRQVVQLTPDGGSDKPKLLKKHGRALQTRFERFGEMADLTKAISSYKRASELGI
jgi:tetratricopeptide (TPR) repeat protein